MAIHRGEIYFVNLNPVKGREQAGNRPVLVLSIDAINKLPLVITVVVGTKGENISRDYPTNEVHHRGQLSIYLNLMVQEAEREGKDWSNLYKPVYKGQQPL